MNSETEYDEVRDILYINKVPPYPEQESEQLAYNVVVRRNPRTSAVENLEVLFFTRWLFKSHQPKVSGLRDLFAEPDGSVLAADGTLEPSHAARRKLRRSMK